MKWYFKGDRCCSSYTCLPQTAPAAAQTVVKTVAAPGTPLVARSLLAIATPNNHRKHTHICKPKTNTKKQYTNTSKQCIKLS